MIFMPDGRMKAEQSTEQFTQECGAAPGKNSGRIHTI